MSSQDQTLTLKNDLAEISRLSDFIDAFCEPLNPSPKKLNALHLALEEIVTNIINHGYTDGAEHLFTVFLTARDQRVTAVVTDDAIAYDPLARPEVDLTVPIEDRPIGGLGVHLVKKLMDAVRYERNAGRNILTLELALAPSL